MIYKLEKAQEEGMKITKKGEPLPLKFYNGVVSSRLAIGMHPSIKGAYDTGLTAAQQKDFEERIGLEEGQLGLKSDYWADFGIYVKAEGEYLNDEDGEDALKIFQLKRRKDVAQSKLEVKRKAGIKWLLASEETEAEIETTKRDSLISALKAFEAMSPNDMRQYLEAQKIDTHNMSALIVKKKVGDDAEKKSRHFLTIVNDPRNSDKIFIHELIKYSILRLSGSKYINDNNDAIAFSDDDMLVYISDKNNTQQIAIWKKQLLAAKKQK